MIEVALTFPTVIFTVTAGASLGFMILSLLTGFGDGDVGVDDFGADGFGGDDVGGVDDTGSEGAGGGVLATVLGGLHLTGVPPVIVFTLTTSMAWAASMGLSLLADLPARGGTTLALGGTVIGLVSFIGGLLATSVVARPLARAFQWTPATRQQELVGRICRVRTATVTERHGQAEVDLPGHGTLLVQVRAEVPNEFTTHSPALLVELDHDTGAFIITAADDLI